MKFPVVYIVLIYCWHKLAWPWEEGEGGGIFQRLLCLLNLSVKEGEELDKSAELLTFHEAINNLVESEEQLVEEHKAIIQVWEGTRGIRNMHPHTHTHNYTYKHNKIHSCKQPTGGHGTTR